MKFDILVFINRKISGTYIMNTTEEKHINIFNLFPPNVNKLILTNLISQVSNNYDIKKIFKFMCLNKTLNSYNIDNEIYDEIYDVLKKHSYINVDIYNEKYDNKKDIIIMYCNNICINCYEKKYVSYYESLNIIMCHHCISELTISGNFLKTHYNVSDDILNNLNCITYNEDNKQYLRTDIEKEIKMTLNEYKFLQKRKMVDDISKNKYYKIKEVKNIILNTKEYNYDYFNEAIDFEKINFRSSNIGRLFEKVDEIYQDTKYLMKIDEHKDYDYNFIKRLYPKAKIINKLHTIENIIEKADKHYNLKQVDKIIMKYNKKLRINIIRRSDFYKRYIKGSIFKDNADIELDQFEDAIKNYKLMKYEQEYDEENYKYMYATVIYEEFIKEFNRQCTLKNIDRDAYYHSVGIVSKYLNVNKPYFTQEEWNDYMDKLEDRNVIMLKFIKENRGTIPMELITKTDVYKNIRDNYIRDQIMEKMYDYETGEKRTDLIFGYILADILKINFAKKYNILYIQKYDKYNYFNNYFLDDNERILKTIYSTYDTNKARFITMLLKNWKEETKGPYKDKFLCDKCIDKISVFNTMSELYRHFSKNHDNTIIRTFDTYSDYSIGKYLDDYKMCFE